MVPPEVVLDRWIKERCRRRESGFSEYLGVLDVETVEPHSFRSFLHLIKETINEALRLEGPNASGGVEHPPFHFDYVAVQSSIENAHAIQHGGYSFIAVTLPMVELIFEISRQLSRTALITRFFVPGPEAPDQDVLHGLLFQIEMNFLVSHEYTHHVHRHFVEASASTQLRNELPIGRGRGGLDPQAQELDADGYAVMLVLAYLLRSERRTGALEALGQADLPILAGDEVLLLCFLLTTFAYFCSFWRTEADTVSLYDLTHPPPPIRIKYVIEVTKMWCSLNESLPTTWFDPARLQRLFAAAAELIDARRKQTWQQQISVLRSREGDEYDGRLYSRFEELRRNPNASVARMAEAPMSSPNPDIPT